MENILWLMNWFHQNCNGDWEHNNSIKISTLDNPGWLVKIDLTDTDDQGKTLSAKAFNSDEDWYEINCNGYTFNAFGDSSKLPLLIASFRDICDSEAAITET